MATLAFVLFWILVALGLLMFALRGSPRDRAAGPGRAGQTFWLGAMLASIVILGIGVPGAIIIDDKNDDDLPSAGISNLTAQEERGREIFAQRCQNCHTLEATNAVAEVGPNLDELKPPPVLIQDAVENGRARGNGAMPADLAEGQDLDAVVAFVAKAVGTSGQ